MHVTSTPDLTKLTRGFNSTKNHSFVSAWLAAEASCLDYMNHIRLKHAIFCINLDLYQSWRHSRQDGFDFLYACAVQITALGNPKLLERVAAGLMAIRNMFSQFDVDMNNVITREEFIKVTVAF